MNYASLFKVWYFFATGFGIGIFFQGATGTIASLSAIPIWWVLSYFFSYRVYLVFLCFGIGLGIYFCSQAEKIIGMHDHQSIVWDEFVGMWMTLTVVSIYNLKLIIIAFLLFRLFDIIKPWPISWFHQNIKGGFGIMIDDIVSSIIAICIIYLMSFCKLCVINSY